MSSDEIWECARTRRDDAGVENQGDKGQGHVDVEKGGDFLAACSIVSAGAKSQSREVNIPTAVNFDRTWIIMIAVMTRARMCIKSVAPWNIIVFANSMDLE